MKVFICLNDECYQAYIILNVNHGNLLCLLYQTYSLVKQYLVYNSVINIKFTPNVIHSLQAITVCYNRLYSFEKLVQHLPGYEVIYENYTKFLRKYTSVDP